MKLTRTSFLKMLGVSPFVAKALVSDGTRAAKLKTCQNARYACRGGCDVDCQYQCSGLTGCTACNVCAAPCEVEDAVCGSGCSLECLRVCGRRTVPGECASCSVCRVP